MSGRLRGVLRLFVNGPLPREARARRAHAVWRASGAEIESGVPDRREERKYVSGPRPLPSLSVSPKKNGRGKAAPASPIGMDVKKLVDSSASSGTPRGAARPRTSPARRVGGGGAKKRFCFFLLLGESAPPAAQRGPLAPSRSTRTTVVVGKQKNPTSPTYGAQRRRGRGGRDCEKGGGRGKKIGPTGQKTSKATPHPGFSTGEGPGGNQDDENRRRKRARGGGGEGGTTRG